MRESTTRFTSTDPDRKIGFDGEVGPLRPKGAYIFEPAAGGTRPTVRVDPNGRTTQARLASVIWVGKRVWDKRLARIKAVLETSAS